MKEICNYFVFYLCQNRKDGYITGLGYNTSEDAMGDSIPHRRWHMFGKSEQCMCPYFILHNLIFTLGD